MSSTERPARAQRRLLSIVAIALVATGCGVRVPAPARATPQALDGVSDNLIQHGCYRCLEKAYEDAQMRGARAHAFEAAALLTLRSKELGLPAETWLERARALAAADGSSSVYLEIVDVIPPDRLSANRDALRRRPAQAGARQAGHVAPGARERPWIRRVPRLSRCLSRLRVRNIEGDRPELLRFGRSSHGHTAHAVRGRFWKSSDSHRSSTPSSITNLVARLAL